MEKSRVFVWIQSNYFSTIMSDDEYDALCKSVVEGGGRSGFVHFVNEEGAIVRIVPSHVVAVIKDKIAPPQVEPSSIPKE